jgi:hypothetical protein
MPCLFFKFPGEARSVKIKIVYRPTPSNSAGYQQKTQVSRPASFPTPGDILVAVLALEATCITMDFQWPSVLFAQQIERFGGFFSQTDDPLWWIHTILRLA